MEPSKRPRSLRERWEAHPLPGCVLLSLALGAAGGLVFLIWNAANSTFLMVRDFLVECLFWWLLSAAAISLFVAPPLVLTAAEVYLLVVARKREALYARGRSIDIVTILLGVLYSVLLLSVLNVVFSDWTETLSNAEKHTPLWTQAWPTVGCIALAACLGYLLVNFLPLERTPPLALVLGFAGMYLGTAESLVWAVQIISPNPLYLPLLLLPLNCVLITARTVLHKIWAWNQLESDWERQYSRPWLQKINDFLANSAHWPVLALVLMWPLLGVLIALLALLGQQPDAIIKAFTETSDWNLSQQVSPQNIYYDEHYLCTVAAGGHRKVVKPLRMGVRHGHPVIVNRQLCVANAFEQVLEEKTPRFHRAVRGFYDKYGFPVAKRIRSRYAADGVYLLMKPLEGLFLAVLYLTDVNPESRIAIQYTGKKLSDFA
ncbi:MAG: hypothetical protein LUD78_02115 [Clostridiales bacterium]|nr:hypothetical protein [Clostridiales bacterium]